MSARECDVNPTLVKRYWVPWKITTTTATTPLLHTGTFNTYIKARFTFNFTSDSVVLHKRSYMYLVVSSACLSAFWQWPKRVHSFTAEPE